MPFPDGGILPGAQGPNAQTALIYATFWAAIWRNPVVGDIGGLLLPLHELIMLQTLGCKSFQASWRRQPPGG